MPEPKQDTYFYVDPSFIIKPDCGGKEFLKEHINTFISTMQCMKRIISACVDNNEIENLTHCLLKLKSSIADLNITSLTCIIDKLISGAENAEHIDQLKEKLNEFLLICELVEMDLEALKQNEGIID
jgi:hypothetical protein